VVATHDASIYAGTEHRIMELCNGRLSAHPNRSPRQIELFDA
jgi:ABC-type ATPase involved in cell division